MCSFSLVDIQPGTFITWSNVTQLWLPHYSDVIMGTMASQITSLTIVYSTIYLGADQRKHQSSASLAFVRGIHRWTMNSPHKGPVTWKMFPFDDVIMSSAVTKVQRRPNFELTKCTLYLTLKGKSLLWGIWRELTLSYSQCSVIYFPLPLHAL